AAATALPVDAVTDASTSIDQEPQSGLATPLASGGKAMNSAIKVDEYAGPEASIDGSADPVLVVGNAAAQPAQSAGAVFRQSSSSAKARAQGPGQGAADPQSQAHQSNQGPQPKPLVASNTSVSDPSLRQMDGANGGVA